MYKHETTLESKQLLKILVATFYYFSNFRATFGCTDKQLFTNLNFTSTIYLCLIVRGSFCNRLYFFVLCGGGGGGGEEGRWETG